MLLKNALSLLACVSFATNVQSALIGRANNEIGAPSEPRLAPQLDERSPALAKRAPTLLSDYENGVLRALSEQIRDKLKAKDLVLFLGNSGSYLLYPFNADSYNMHSLPISKTKYWNTNEKNGVGKATDAGLDRYFNKVLLERLDKQKFDRIVIIDHSGTGGSIDGFRDAFKAIINRAYTKKKFDKKTRDSVLDTPWYFINVVDWRRRPDSKNPTVDPKTKIIKKISHITFESPNDVINGILGDEDKHPRVACEYYPARWEQSVQDCWKEDGILEAAKVQRQAILDWNTANGGLITTTNPPKQPKADKKKDTNTWIDNGYEYKIVKNKNGKLEVVRKKIN